MGGISVARGLDRPRRYKWNHTDSRGASLVEMALVLPLLLMLLMGIVSAGLAYNHQLSLTHAARESGRHAATLPVTNFSDMDGWVDAVAQRTFDDAVGTLDPGTPGLYVCVAFVHPNGTAGLDRTRRFVNDEGMETYSDTSCFSDGRPGDERRVQVRLEREVTFNALVFQTELTLGSEAVNRYEGGPGS